MCQKRLRKETMSSAVYVEQARSQLDDLVREESRGSGDTANAIRRIARREGLSFSYLWRVRYREIKDVYASTFFTLNAAHEAMCDRMERRLQDAKKQYEGTTRISEALLRLAGAAGGNSDGGEA